MIPPGKTDFERAQRPSTRGRRGNQKRRKSTALYTRNLLLKGQGGGGKNFRDAGTLRRRIVSLASLDPTVE